MKRRGQKTLTPAPPHSSSCAASAPDHPKSKCNVKHKSGKLIIRMVWNTNGFVLALVQQMLRKTTETACEQNFAL